VKAAAADDVESSRVDVELTLDSSSHEDPNPVSAPQAVPNVSNTLDPVGDITAEQKYVDGMEGPRSSLNTQSTADGDLSPLQGDLEDVLPTTDSCCNARSLGSLTEGRPLDTLVEDGACSDASAVGKSNVSADVDETEGPKLSTVVTADNVQHHNHLSSCNELSSSLTDSLGICEQGAVDTTGCGLVQAAELGANTATDLLAPTSKCTPTPCQCNGESSVDVVESVPMPADAESSQCHCDVSEPDQSPAETPQPPSGHVHSSVASENDLILSAINENSRQTSGDTVGITIIPTLNFHDHETPALSTSVSDVSEITSVVEMETETDESSSSVIDAAVISSALEPDCEHGGKASKLDKPSSADCSTSDDFEPSDTGALHMSVGFQLTPSSDKVAATFDADSRDTSIGILMVCDDDGIVSSVSAVTSPVVSDSSEAGFLASSTGGDYNSVVADSSSSFTAQLSDDVAAENRPSDVTVTASGQVDNVNLSAPSEAVAAEDVMLCEVDTKSHEMDELLADVSQTVINTSHGARLSDTSIFSHDDSEFCYQLTRRTLKY